MALVSVFLISFISIIWIAQDCLRMLIKFLTRDIHESANRQIEEVKAMLVFERERNDRNSLMAGISAIDSSKWVNSAHIGLMRSWFITTLPKFTQQHFNWFINEYVYRRVIDQSGRVGLIPLPLYHHKHHDQFGVWGDDYSLAHHFTTRIKHQCGWSMFALSGPKMSKCLTPKSAETLFDSAFGSNCHIRPRIRANYHISAHWLLTNSVDPIEVRDSLVLMPRIIQHIYSTR
jgi:hypothetical protein